MSRMSYLKWMRVGGNERVDKVKMEGVDCVKWGIEGQRTSFLTLEESKRSHAPPNIEKFLLLTSLTYAKFTFLFTKVVISME
jgi:hypothetical protein